MLGASSRKWNCVTTFDQSNSLNKIKRKATAHKFRGKEGWRIGDGKGEGIKSAGVAFFAFCGRVIFRNLSHFLPVQVQGDMYSTVWLFLLVQFFIETRSGPKIPAAGHLEGVIFWDSQDCFGFLKLVEKRLTTRVFQAN